jgi:hypothetical protein
MGIDLSALKVSLIVADFSIFALKMAPPIFRSGSLI